jgi:TonB-linked SusC/RagA family outer membrane protein
MRKAILLHLFAIVCTAQLLAQTRTISGVVNDANGKPVPFASITIKGTKTGVTADADGMFLLKGVAAGTILLISSVGFESKEISVGANDYLNISLGVPAGNNITEVVVTSAFGIKNPQRITPYSTQVVKSEQLNIIPQTNVVDALAGKLAGVQTRSQSDAKLNQSDELRIRGGLSITDVPPVFVMDGTIVNSFDINPDDVEDITVLKGANATALFGERATGGAIVINTKKGSIKQDIGVELTQSVTVNRVYVFPDYQNEFAGGASDQLIQYSWQPGQPAEWQALDGKFFHDYTDDASWGPRMSGQEYIPWYAWFPGNKYSFKTALLNPQPHNARDFYNTGTTSTTNAAFSKSGLDYKFRVSYTNQNIQGVIPASNSIRHTILAAGSMDLNNHFTAGINATYTTQRIRGEFSDGYANQSSGSFNQWFHRNLDMKIMMEMKNVISPFGALAGWNFITNPDGAAGYNDLIGNYWYNFYSYFENQNNLSSRDAVYGDVFLRYKMNNHFSFKTTVRKNQQTRWYENISTSLLEKSAGQSGYLAGYGTGESYYREYNFEGLASWNNNFFNNRLTVNINAGANVLTTESKSVNAATVNGLNVPDYYAINNSKAQPSMSNDRSRSRINSLFAAGDAEWNKTISITFAIRNDWYSMNPPTRASLFSPSVGASFVFSELTKKALQFLNFGKLFVSWGGKPRPLRIYQNNFGYATQLFQWNGNFLMTTPNQSVASDLSGSVVNTYEGGIDLRLFKNRLGINFSYYLENNDGEPLTVAISAVSGFTSIANNSVHVKREGLEVQLNAMPVKGKNFSWELTKTYGYLVKNPVVSIDGVPTGRILLAGGAFGNRFARAFHEVGHDWGQLIGGGIKRNAEGKLVINPTTGYYIADANKRWGSVVPKHTGGIINKLTYRDVTLTFSLDYQAGGKFFSLTENFGNFSGLLDETAAINDRDKSVRDPVSAGGGVHITGVSSVDEKTPIDMYISAFDYFHQFYFQRIAEPYIHDLSFVKLREVSFTYRIPVKKLGKASKVIQGINISLVARNVWIIYTADKNFDVAESAGVYGEDGQLPGVRGIGVGLKLIF